MYIYTNTTLIQATLSHVIGGHICGFTKALLHFWNGILSIKFSLIGNFGSFFTSPTICRAWMRTPSRRRIHWFELESTHPPPFRTSRQSPIKRDLPFCECLNRFSPPNHFTTLWARIYTPISTNRYHPTFCWTLSQRYGWVVLTFKSNCGSFYFFNFVLSQISVDGLSNSSDFVYSWTTQAGIPYINVSKNSDSSYTITQERFFSAGRDPNNKLVLFCFI